MKAMPQVVSLYSSVSKKLNENGDFSLESSADEKRFAIIAAVAECDDEIRALDEALRAYGTIDPEYLKDSVSKNSDADALNSFINGNTPMTCEEVISALTDIKESGTADIDALYELLVAYVYSYSPYLAFAVSLNQ